MRKPRAKKKRFYAPGTTSQLTYHTPRAVIDGVNHNRFQRAFSKTCTSSFVSFQTFRLESDSGGCRAAQRNSTQLTHLRQVRCLDGCLDMGKPSVDVGTLSSVVAAACEKRISLFECSAYVCPEPVLVS